MEPKQDKQAMPADTDLSPPVFSILIGMVSTEDRWRILETLNALRQQKGNFSYEVIIGDRRNDEISEIITREYPEVKQLFADSSTSLPALRTKALEHASGKYIVVTEDHCVPYNDWLESFSLAFDMAPDETMAVGGCVENGVFDSSFDWATFFCEYSFFLEPVHEGTGNVLPGMNVAYRKEVFLDVDRETLTSGFWETTLHPKLINQGFNLFSTNNVKLFHSKKFSLGLFLRQRFIYSRYYAGLRFKSTQRFHRLAACCATILLPPILLYRMIKQIRAKNRLKKELVAASPYLALFIVVWALGEMWGYVFGANTALADIE